MRASSALTSAQSAGAAAELYAAAALRRSTSRPMPPLLPLVEVKVLLVTLRMEASKVLLLLSFTKVIDAWLMVTVERSAFGGSKVLQG